jgi:flagellin
LGTRKAGFDTPFPAVPRIRLPFRRAPDEIRAMATISLRNNVGALATARNLGNAQEQVDRAMLRLSTGLRINRASDDAAGLALSEKMRAQVGGLAQAARNARDAKSLAQTAEGSLAEVNNMLLRMRDLAVASVNDVNTVSERAALQKELSQLQTEVTRLASATEFNGQKLLDGSFLGKRFQIGANAGQEITLSIGGVNSSSLGANVAETNGTITSAKNIAPATAGTNGVAAQTLTLTGPSGSSTVAVAANAAASTIASSINSASASAGITATAETNLELRSVGLSAAVGATVAGDGQITFTLGTTSAFAAGATPITIAATFSQNGDVTSIIEAINAQSAATGVTAEVGSSSSVMRLRQPDGKDVFIESVRIRDAAGADVGGPALLVQGLRRSGGTLVDSGSENPFPVLSGAVVGGTVTLRANGTLLASTSATGTLFTTSSATSTSTTLATLSVLSADGASAALGVIDSAISELSDERANLGAFQNRIDATVSNLESTIENLSLAESRVRDADIALEATALARSLVLVEAGVAVMAQANQAPRLALRLLGVAA